MVYHDISQEQLLLLITQAVQAELQKRSRQVPVGISVRHIHLTRDDVDKLFGYGYQLTPKKALSQPGQFACEECLDIIGPKGELKHVRILGPERSATQIELHPESGNYSGRFSDQDIRFPSPKQDIKENRIKRRARI